MPARSQERKQFLFDVFVTAMEGGCGYWSTREKYHIYVSGTEKEDLDGFNARIRDDEDEDKPSYFIDINLIAKGINRIVNGSATCGGEPLSDGPESLRSRIKKASAEMEAGDIDASDADCVIQVGLFNDIVYG